MTPETIDAMLAAGASAEVIAAAWKSEIAAQGKLTELRREKDRERKRRKRHAESRGVTRTNAESRGVTRTNAESTDPAPKEINQTPTQSKTKPIGLAKKPDRGSRLPNGWRLPDEWRQWARERRGWSDRDVSEEAELFGNYWQAKSGAGACHTDWFKTWRNWVIRSHRPDGKFGKKVEKTAPELRELAEWYVRHGQPDRADECRQKAIALEQRFSA